MQLSTALSTALESQTAEPSAATDFDSLIDQVISWLFWGGITISILTIVWIGIAVIVGMRNRSQQAADALGRLPQVFAGSILIASAAKIADMLINI
jgi:threonine/homoserine/homoserine lactone efflux protein